MNELFAEPVAAATTAELSPQSILIRLAAGVLIGLLVGLSYFASQSKSLAAVWSFLTTLVLLTMLVAVTTLVIGNSTARAFALVGALSIVRFRTVVDDTRDTAFVIYAVTMGMAVGAGNLTVCLLGIPVTSATAVALHFVGQRAGVRMQHLLEIRLGTGLDPEVVLQPLMRQYFSSMQFISATTARQGAALEVKYRVQLRDVQSPVSLVRDLNRVEGMQQVELREG